MMGHIVGIIVFLDWSQAQPNGSADNTEHMLHGSE
jgi:hypothetical protein